MATIRRYPFYSHVTSSATRVLLQASAGRQLTRGAGASMWFRPLGAALSEVPVHDLELGGIFHVTTLDHQDVSVQTALTVRFVNPELAAQRIDFAIDTKTGEWVGRPLQVLQSRVTEIAQQYAAQIAGTTVLATLLDDGLRLVHDAISAGIQSEVQLQAAGLEVVGVRVVAVRADEELERALQTKVRESIQAEADRATYDRRAQAVDLERAIKENELNNQTELARREANLVELQGANERRRTEQEIERDELRSEAALKGKRLDVDARVDEIARVADAENLALAARLASFAGAELPALVAVAAPDVIAALPKVDSLTVTPDSLTSAVARVVSELRSA